MTTQTELTDIMLSEKTNRERQTQHGIYLHVESKKKVKLIETE